MDKQEVIKNLSAIYYTLNEVEVKGVQNVIHVTNIFGALKNIISELSIEEQEELNE